MKRRAIAVLGVLAVAAIVWRVFFWSTDEDEIRARIYGLAAAGSAAEGSNPAMFGLRVRSAMKEALAPGATIDATELGGAGLGADDATAGAVRLAAGRRSTVVVVRDLIVKVNGTSSDAVGQVVLTALEQSGGVHVDQRTVHFQLTKLDGDWRITHVLVDSPE